MRPTEILVLVLVLVACSALLFTFGFFAYLEYNRDKKVRINPS